MIYGISSIKYSNSGTDFVILDISKGVKDNRQVFTTKLSTLSVEY